MAASSDSESVTNVSKKESHRLVCRRVKGIAEDVKNVGSVEMAAVSFITTAVLIIFTLASKCVNVFKTVFFNILNEAHFIDVHKLVFRPAPIPSLTGITKSQMLQAQMDDKGSQEMISWINKGDRPLRRYLKSPEAKHLLSMWNKLELHDGVLYRKWTDDSTSVGRLLFIVPKSLQGVVL